MGKTINIFDDFTREVSQEIHRIHRSVGKTWIWPTFGSMTSWPLLNAWWEPFWCCRPLPLKKGVENSSFWVNLGQDLRAIELVGTDYSGLFRNFVDSKLRLKSFGHHDETFAILAKVECRMSFHNLCLWICMDCDNVYVESIDTWFMSVNKNESCSLCPCSYPTLDSLDTVCPG